MSQPIVPPQPVQPFDIDEGALDGLSPERAFALGVEWQAFRVAAQEGKLGEYTVHLSNAKRLQALAARLGISTHLSILNDDWAVICDEEHPNDH